MADGTELPMMQVCQPSVEGTNPDGKAVPVEISLRDAARHMPSSAAAADGKMPMAETSSPSTIVHDTALLKFVADHAEKGFRAISRWCDGFRKGFCIGGRRQHAGLGRPSPIRKHRFARYRHPSFRFGDANAKHHGSGFGSPRPLARWTR
jgi:hypothetical protein